MLEERPDAVAMRGNPMTLLGPELHPGDEAPDFEAVSASLEMVTLASSNGRTRIFSVVPSLDTPVCDAQTRRINDEAEELPEGVVVYTVSADLPFAAARFAKAVDASNVEFLSDHRTMSFGDAYGTHLKELRLETRALFVVDGNDRIAYAEYVKELSNQPNYEAALEAVRKATEG